MTCRRVLELAGRALDVPLTLAQWLGVRTHTLYCVPCRRARRQLLRLDAACRHLVEVDLPTPAEGLPLEARERVAAAIGRAVTE